MERLVTVATFSLAAEAEAHKLLLQQEGIRAFLGDDNLVTMNWFFSNAVGGVKLQVAVSDADQARKILEDYRTPKDNAAHSVTFACEECGQSITFPRERCGHVETCPACDAYVDVPFHTQSLGRERCETDSSPSGTERPGLPKDFPSHSRTASQLWIEVLAVLCLGYFPYLVYALQSFGMGQNYRSFVDRELTLLVYAFQVSVPLLMILSLTGDPWSRFGIVRPHWAADALLGMVACVGGMIAAECAMSFLPASLLRAAKIVWVEGRLHPEGMPEYVLLLFACSASGFAEEAVMRGYLIPRFERLLESTWLPVLVTSLLFGSYHLYQGIAPAVGCVALGLVYAVVFCLSRRIWPLAIAHALHNFTLYA